MRSVTEAVEFSGVAARLPAQDLNRARTFYAEKLDLEPNRGASRGLLYRCGSGLFAGFASGGSLSGSHTQISFEVADLLATVRILRARDIVFEEYDVPGLMTADGVAEVVGNHPSKGGRKELAAWFKDSEGMCLAWANPCDEDAPPASRCSCGFTHHPMPVIHASSNKCFQPTPGKPPARRKRGG
jgi:hypothetical protein